VVVEEASSATLASALQALLAIRRIASGPCVRARFDWQPTTRALIDMYPAVGAAPLSAVEGARS